ncbi:MAG: hypothetical protein ACR2QM_03440 [Longimicrobiales bacterium]
MSQRRRWTIAVAKLVGVGCVIGLAIWANLRAGELEAIRDTVARLGYPGLFGASVISGFNLVFPIPVVAFFPFLMESGFSPVPSLVTIAAGMTGGDFVGYLIGDASKDLVGDRMAGLRGRIERLHARHPVLPLCVMFLYAAFAPIPNELLVIPLAFMGYPLLAVMGAVLVGNVVFNTLAAYGVSFFFLGVG